MPLLRTKADQSILYLFLSDLDNRNAFSPDMAEELYERLQNEKFRALILSHDGDFFCSGGNLKFYQKLSSGEEGLQINNRIREILGFIEKLSVPKACFVNGPCLGGGVELLSCFDYVTATPQSLFGLWQRRIGLTLGWGAQNRLCLRLGDSQLKNWLLSAKTLPAYQAHHWGLIDQVFLEYAGLDGCRDWVTQCLSLGTSSLECMLEGWSDQNKVFSQLWHGEKHMAALKRFK